MIKEKLKCEMCGTCCKLFYINLIKEEYNSGKYKTIFRDFEKMNFETAEECGANFLEKQKDGSCVYLKNNACQIHQKRPKVCRKFFCGSKDKKFDNMKQRINEEKAKY